MTNARTLSSLVIQSCHVAKLPREITSLPPDCEFDFDGNPLQEPPYETVQQGRAAIARYFDQMDGGSVVSRQLKVVLVGDGEAGKTTLRHALAGREPPPETEGLEDQRTIFLDIDRFVVSNPEPSSTDVPLTLSIYDCGGQAAYAKGQAPFFTESSLFLLVVDVNRATEEHYNATVKRFLELLQVRVPGAVIQLVLSKIDVEPDSSVIDEKEKWLKRKVTDDVDEFKKKLCSLDRKRSSRYDEHTNTTAKHRSVAPIKILPDVLRISALRASIAASVKVRNAIVNNLDCFPSVGQKIPESWLSVWRFLGAVCRHGADYKELFQVAPSAPRISDVDVAVAASCAYWYEDRLRSLFGEFLHRHEMPRSLFGEFLHRHGILRLLFGSLFGSLYGSLFGSVIRCTVRCSVRCTVRCSVCCSVGCSVRFRFAVWFAVRFAVRFTVRFAVQFAVRLLFGSLFGWLFGSLFSFGAVRRVLSS